MKCEKGSPFPQKKLNKLATPFFRIWNVPFVFRGMAKVELKFFFWKRKLFSSSFSIESHNFGVRCGGMEGGGIQEYLAAAAKIGSIQKWGNRGDTFLPSISSFRQKRAAGPFPTLSLFLPAIFFLFERKMTFSGIWCCALTAKKSKRWRKKKEIYTWQIPSKAIGCSTQKHKFACLSGVAKKKERDSSWIRNNVAKKNSAHARIPTQKILVMTHFKGLARSSSCKT